MPMSFSGVSSLASISFALEAAPTPGTSFRLQSWSGREMNELNFLVVVVVIHRMRNKPFYMGFYGLFF
jgi:hypothetical protein